MDIVIGYQGKDHVKAEQLRRLITGLSGAGTYVLDTQNKLAASMLTANQVRIDTGDIVAAGGAYATVETPETLTIESGATGQKRVDLVVARYEKDASTSIESMELAVVKGAPVPYGEAADPEVQEGSIIAGDSPVEVPLWRIPIDGLAPGAPEQIFETIPSIDSLRDSVSHLEKVTPWTDLWRDAGGHVSYRRVGHMVEMEWDFEQASSSVWTVPQTLPEGFRPDRSAYYSGAATDSGGNPVDRVSYLWLGSDGRAMFAVPTATYGNRNAGHAVWCVV